MSKRAEIRRIKREQTKKNDTVYTLTQAELDALVRDMIAEEIKKLKDEATDEAICTTLTLLLGLPMKVLMDHYWVKSYEKRIPEFADLVLEYYGKWENGELDLDDLKEELWTLAGIKFVEETVE